mgnify:CR=1 FL=1
MQKHYIGLSSVKSASAFEFRGFGDRYFIMKGKKHRKFGAFFILAGAEGIEAYILLSKPF